MKYSAGDEHSHYRIQSGVQGSKLKPLFTKVGDLGSWTLCRNDILILSLGVIHTLIYSRAFQRMGLLHRLNWEGKGRNGAWGSGSEEAQNVIPYYGYYLTLERGTGIREET